MELSLRLLFKDQLSGPMKQAVQQVERDTARLKDTVGQLGTAYDKATAKAGEGFKSLNSALGMTAKKTEEVATQVEKQATRMERAMAMVNKAASAGAEGVKLWGQAVAGYEAGKFILGKPVGRAMDYDLRLANLANTAYAGESVAARRSGMKGLDASIQAAVRYGGGSRDAAADTLDSLIASGAVSTKDAKAMLPALMRAGTASNADPTQLANIAIRSMQSFGLKAGDVDGVLDMALVAGQKGGFELKDMARWLPQQMAAARMSGLNGQPGLAKLLAANQAAAITAGTKDEAGNNLVNLLAKLNSRDTAIDAKKLGIDLSGTLSAARGKGVDSLTAFVGLVDSITAKDANFQSLRAKAAKGGGNAETYAAQADILQGSAIGKIIQDRQGMMALIGLMNNRGYMAEVEASLANSKGAIAGNYDLISGTQSFKNSQLDAEKQFAESKSFDVYGGLLGKATEGLTEFARTYPNLTASANSAAHALTALAAIAGAAGLVGILSGKVKPEDLIKNTKGTVTKAKTAVKAAPAALTAAGVGSGGLLAVTLPLMLGGDSREGGTALTELERKLHLLQTDLAQANKGYRRGDGWLFDSYEKVGSKEQQTALIKQLAAEIEKIQLSVQIDGREVARAVTGANVQDSRRQ